MMRIKDLCNEAGCRVEFRMEEDDFVVAFYRNLREEWNNANDGAKEKDVRATIIECIKQDERITIAGIVTNTGVSRRTVDRVIKGLKEENILERVGSSRSGYWRLRL